MHEHEDHYKVKPRTDLGKNIHLSQNSRRFLKGKKNTTRTVLTSANFADASVFDSIGTKHKVNTYLGIEHGRERVGKNMSF